MDKWSEGNDALPNNNCTILLNAILVVKGTSTQIFKKSLKSYEPYNFELFIQDELLVNITKHELVPKHMILTDQEKLELLKRYRAKAEQLPKIQC